MPIRVTVVQNVKVENNQATGCKHFVTDGPRVKNLELKDNLAVCSKGNYTVDDNSVQDLNLLLINKKKILHSNNLKD